MAHKILYTGTLPPHTGGSALSCSQILTGIVDAGYLVAAIAPVTAASLDGGDLFAAANPGIRMLRYMLPHYDNGPGESELQQAEEVQVCRLFEESVRSFRPHLVVVGRESFARYVPTLASRHKLPILQWSRGGPYSGYPYWSQTEDGKQLVRNFRKAERIIAVADHLTEDLLRLGFDNVTTIPNAIDLSSFSPRASCGQLREEFQIAEDQMVVLVPGNLIPRKRPLDIVRSAGKATKQNPSLVYIMAGRSFLQDELDRVCEEEGVGSHFRFPGWVDYERMPDLYNLADIVIMASEAEGLARAYIEAMASECLLLTSDIPAARELVVDGENGMLFPVGDTEKIAEKTVLAAGDRSLRSRIGREARKSVQNRSLDKAVRHYLREIEAVLNSGNTKRSFAGGERQS